jgi:hypothetical protein
LTLAAPERGSVIRYAYLWADESARGREEGRKDRPAVVLALSVKDVDGTTDVLALAVTHMPPTHAGDAVPFPQDLKRRIGLDDAPSWIVTTEANAFVWPGPDIRPVPNRTPTTVIYGRVPDGLLRQIARAYLANRDKQRARLIQRTE